MNEAILKVSGVICIVASTALWGEYKARSLSLRLQQLRHFQQALRLLSTEISFTATPLPYAFKSIGNQIPGVAGKVFQEASRLLRERNDMNAQEAWRESLGVMSLPAFLTPDDLKILENMGISLGMSDRENQLKQIQLVSKQLEFAVEEALEKRNSSERMWRYLGFLGGVVLVIFLL